MTMKIVKRKDVLTSQEKDVTIKINTTFRLKSLIDYENESIGLYDYSRTVTKKRVFNVYVKKDDRNKTEL